MSQALGPFSSLSCIRQGTRFAQLVQGLTGPGSLADKTANILELNALRGVRCRDADLLKAQHLQVDTLPTGLVFPYTGSRHPTYLHLRLLNASDLEQRPYGFFNHNSMA